jgi:hypothetical protein
MKSMLFSFIIVLSNEITINGSDRADTTTSFLFGLFDGTHKGSEVMCTFVQPQNALQLESIDFMCLGRMLVRIALDRSRPNRRRRKWHQRREVPVLQSSSKF